MFRLTLIVIAIVVVSTGLYMAYTSPSSLPPQLQSFAPLVKTGVDGVKVALGKSKDAQPAVLGVKSETSKMFQEDTAGKPIHQKALEFTQYQYCKLVVKSYEDDQNKVSASPSAAPNPEEN